ncbi:MAG TPA: hypothetical protein DEG69_21810 [Flavobacteriaceae bacterium]|nr:hypothetical protein [Flavobacteriaceae bacterium]
MKSRLKRKKIELELAELDMEDIELVAQNCSIAFGQNFIHQSKLKENEEAKKKEDEYNNLSEEQKAEIKQQSNDNEPRDISKSANKTASKEAKSLFKKIAVETHPDKLSNASEQEKDLKNRYFLKAQKAIEDNDLASLLEVADKLNLPSGMVADEEIKIIQVKLDFIRKKIHETRQTAAWIWYHSKDEKKENIEKQLIEQMGFQKINM